MTVDTETTPAISVEGSAEETAPEDQRRRKVRTTRSRVLRWAGALFAVMALIALAVAGWGVYQFNQLNRTDVDLSEAGIDDPQNFLIVGSDTRELDEADADAGNIFGGKKSEIPTGRRADTIVIARLDPQTATAELLSVPRDLWVRKTDGSGDHRRINSAYADGPQEVIDTIEGELGIPIHHYVEINFNGFKDLVDAIGGVPLYFDRPVYDLNTGLNIRKEGCYTLDGIAALAYTRSRHLQWSNGVEWIPDQTGDLGRISRQQVFMRHAATKIAGLGLDDINTLRVLVAVAVNNVTVDDELGTREMLAISRQFDSFTSDKLVVHSLPIEPHRTDGGASVVLVDDAAAEGVLDLFAGREDEPVDETPTTTIPPEEITIDVFNATGTAGLAGRTSESLGAWGFTIGEVADETSPGRSIVRHAPGSEAAAALVGNLISPAPELVEDPTLAENQVQVVLDTSSVDVVPLPQIGAAAAEDAAPSAGGAAAPAEIEDTDATIGVAPGDPPPGITCE